MAWGYKGASCVDVEILFVVLSYDISITLYAIATGKGLDDSMCEEARADKAFDNACLIGPDRVYTCAVIRVYGGLLIFGFVGIGYAGSRIRGRVAR